MTSVLLPETRTAPAILPCCSEQRFCSLHTRRACAPLSLALSGGRDLLFGARFLLFLLLSDYALRAAARGAPRACLFVVLAFLVRYRILCCLISPCRAHAFCSATVITTSWLSYTCSARAHLPFPAALLVNVHLQHAAAHHQPSRCSMLNSRCHAWRRPIPSLLSRAFAAARAARGCAASALSDSRTL